MRGVGKIPVVPPLSGVWPFQGFPKRVAFLGTTFVDAGLWSWPLYSGVTKQYREDVAENAMHMLVYRALPGGAPIWEITHVDEINPALGNPLEHAVVDAPLATTIVCGLAGLGLGLVAGLLLFADD